MKKKLLLLANLILMACLLGCSHRSTGTGNDIPADEPETVFVYKDTCIMTGINTREGKITFQNLETGLRYTLAYDNLTFFTDKYGNGMVDEQLEIGKICDISFYREEKLLKTLDLSADYFEYSNVDKYIIYNAGTRMEYLGDKYELDQNVVISSGRENISALEIASGDELTIIGNDHRIYSVILDKGHGYVSFDHDDYFIDGFVEIGKQIHKITKDMMLTVPEGSYEVKISKDGTVDYKTVTVGRNQEVSVDLGDIEIVRKVGRISFTVSPADAVVFLDGVKLKNYKEPLELEYGIHEIIIRANGYETLSRYISVGSAESSISFILDKLKNEDEKETEKQADEKEDENDSNDEPNPKEPATPQAPSIGEPPVIEGSSDSQNAKRVYIDAPAGAELYLDGNYIGIVPVSFVKTNGTVIITLRKNGCQTRSYTITLEDINNDSHYSFSDLLPNEDKGKDDNNDKSDKNDDKDKKDDTDQSEPEKKDDTPEKSIV